jgi:hypothetical protein
MSALYWPDFDCTPETRRIAHPATVHVHCKTEREACLAFIDLFGEWIDGVDGFGIYEKWSARYDSDHRYACVRGPGGLVRGVVL